MIESATASTMTMAVAADRPPMKAIEGEDVGLPAAAAAPARRVSPSVRPAEHEEAGDGDRHHEDVDGDEIERKQPGGALDARSSLGFSTTVTWNWRGSRMMAMQRQQGHASARCRRRGPW